MSRLDLTENAHDLANTRPSAIAAIVELHLEHNAIPGLLRIARALIECEAALGLSFPFIPGDTARNTVREIHGRAVQALADFEAGQ